MAYLDILLDENEDLQDDGSGDFLTGDASNQLMSYIIRAHPGHYKEFPLVGVGIDRYLNSDVSQYRVVQIIKEQLKRDVFRNAVVKGGDWPDAINVDSTRIEFE